jgi:hypothetical protein
MNYNSVVSIKKSKVLNDIKAKYQRMLASNDIRSKKVLSNESLTQENLSALVDHLLHQLDIKHRTGEEIKPDWETYRATHMKRRKIEVISDYLRKEQS